jgi:hypothetical protein
VPLQRLSTAHGGRQAEADEVRDGSGPVPRFHDERLHAPTPDRAYLFVVVESQIEGQPALAVYLAATVEAHRLQGGNCPDPLV